jgi:hypothetical protein
MAFKCNLFFTVQDTREASEKKAEQTKSLQREHKKIEREKQKAGKRPYYFKKCMLKFF